MTRRFGKHIFGKWVLDFWSLNTKLNIICDHLLQYYGKVRDRSLLGLYRIKLVFISPDLRYQVSATRSPIPGLIAGTSAQ
jgi:hypothetical protein